MEGLAAARALVEQNFPDCDAAFLVGSMARGDATAQSDLDIVVISRSGGSPYQESMHAFGWPVDVMVHNEESYRKFFKIDVMRRRPVLAYMCMEGIILKDHDGFAQYVKDEACKVLAAGPAPLTEIEIRDFRHELANMYDDFVGCDNRAECLILAADLQVVVMEFYLEFHHQWMGEGKWAMRGLYEYDATLAEQYVVAVEDYYRYDRKDKFAEFVASVLDEAGGRVTESMIRGNKPGMPIEEDDEEEEEEEEEAPAMPSDKVRSSIPADVGML